MIWSCTPVLYYIYLILIFSFSLFSRQFKRHCPLIWARNDLKTHQKKKKGKIKGPSTELEQVPVVECSDTGKKGITCLSVNQYVVKIIRTATIDSSCLLILVGICCDMTILQQVEVIFFCHIFGQSLLIGVLHVWLLPKYESSYQGISAKYK